MRFDRVFCRCIAGYWGNGSGCSGKTVTECVAYSATWLFNVTLAQKDKVVTETKYIGEMWHTRAVMSGGYRHGCSCYLLKP